VNTRYGDLADRPGMASPKQLRMIELLWKEVSDVKGFKKRKAALRSFLSNHFKVSDLRFISSEKAAKIIFGLKQMKERKNATPSEPF
jgi:hypothetical protein